MLEWRLCTGVVLVCAVGISWSGVGVLEWCWRAVLVFVCTVVVLVYCSGVSICCSGVCMC